MAKKTPKKPSITLAPPIVDQPTDAADQPIAGFPVVGIGASAGGLAAFEAFFSGMPADSEPGMAFVLVQHLAPDHKSILSDLIKRYTRMQVFEVEDGMKVQPNCAYIIPPNRDMALLNGALQLLEPTEPRGQRLPIDFFFRSLAHDQRERAICIVLSGTGSDGTLGVRAIKDEGGVVMAQSPESTEYDGMPRSAINTGLVDYELPPAEMPAQLIAYVAHAFGKTPLLTTAPESNADSALKKIYVLLRSHTGHDFSQYKPSTIHRRIERRMAVNQIETIGDYLKHLQQTPLEVEALFRDLLIGVTNFFRDPEAFTALEDEVIPALFAGKPPGSVIRVWSPGCSTGEEAYSLAILMQERMEALKQNYKLQVFATDIDRRAIATARAGLYPASIAADISEERLARFFSAEADGSVYRIHKGIRDMLVFSEQDVVKDPPFSKLDLISCRNLMIYMSSDLQKRLIPMFHYALNPNAFLFLGTSETVGEFGALFSVMNRKLKLYKRKEDMHSVQRTALSRFLPANSNIDESPRQFAGKTPSSLKLSLRELTEQALLRQVAPVAALVNSHGDILYLHGRTGMFLEPAPGEVGINNIVKMAREGLRHDLTAALHKAVSGQEIVRHQGVLVKNNGESLPVNLTVCAVEIDPVTNAETPLYLVILEEAASGRQSVQQMAESGAGEGGSFPADVAATITALKQELYAKEEFLQASNEEMQSMNEELQSTNEELETSKEELQSINEELATVNAEMQTKVMDLSRLNNDMNNLLAGTGIATVFVDHQQRILSFTPSASQIVNLLLRDVGRPIGHFVSNLIGYDHLAPDVKAVLDTLIPIEREVRTTAGEWYTMRILPYRTIDNVIEGAVITFVNITDRKRIEETLQETRSILQTAMDQSMAGIAIADAASRTLRYVNEAGLLIHGDDNHSIVSGIGIEEYVAKCYLVDMDGKCLKIEDMPLTRVIVSGEKCSRELMVRRPNGNDRILITNAAPITDAHGKVVAGVMVFMDITELRQAESNAWLSAIVESSHEAIISREFDGTIRSWNKGAVQMFGYSSGEMLGQKIDLLFSAEQPDGFDDFEILSHGAGAGHSEPYCQTKNGSRLAVQFTQSSILGPDGEPVAVSVIMSDISALKGCSIR